MHSKVVCVFRSGGDYRPEHVQRLQAMVHRFVGSKHEFVCLSDQPIRGVPTEPMRRNWPGWWSKLELFEHFQKAFYLDLDTTLLANIDDVVGYRHVFTMLRDLGKPNVPASGVMAWDGDFSGIAETFAEDVEANIKACSSAARWGDQGFIAQHINPEFLQDLFPGAVASYKWQVLRNGLKPENRIVCFHGKPRPWDVKELDVING